MAGNQLTKTCSYCQAQKPLSAFGIETRRPDGLRTHCRDCGAAYKREYRKRNPDYKKYDKHAYQILRQTEEGRQKIRGYKLKEKYGISLKDYEELLRSQSGRCAICGTDKPRCRGGKYFAVDHCHRTGKVRGLLCSRCNRGLATFGDNLDGVMRIVRYLSSAEKP